MNKLVALTVISVLSFGFLLMQVIILKVVESEENIFSSSLHFLNGRINFQLSLRQDKEMVQKYSLHLIKLEGLINASIAMDLPMTLIDLEILNDLVKDLKEPIKDHLHLTSCDHFCKKGGLTFGISIKAQRDKVKLEKLINIGKDRGFDTFVISDFDTRETKLEATDPSLIKSYLFFKWKSLLIEVVVFYLMKQRLWHAPLNLHKISTWPAWHNGHIRQSILKNPYTKVSHIFDEIEPVQLKIDEIYIRVPQFLKTFVDNFERSTYIPCPIANARTFLSKYGYDSSADADVFRVKAKNLLVLVKSVLDVMEIPFWLSSGTCLGWMRQCNFIPHSKDVDIGIWISDFNPNIAEEFQNSGLIPKHIFGKIDDSYELSFQTADKELKLDIFFFYKENDIMWNGGTQAKTGKKFKYIFPAFKLCWTKFVGLLVRVPCPTLPYVTANYGTNWHTLIKTWDWKKSPSNVHENGEWPMEERENVIKILS